MPNRSPLSLTLKGLSMLALSYASIGVAHAAASVKLVQRGKPIVDTTAALGVPAHGVGGGYTLSGYTLAIDDGQSHHYQFSIKAASGEQYRFDIEAPADTCIQQVVDATDELSIRACRAP